MRNPPFIQQYIDFCQFYFTIWRANPLLLIKYTNRNMLYHRCLSVCFSHPPLYGSCIRKISSLVSSPILHLREFVQKGRIKNSILMRQYFLLSMFYFLTLDIIHNKRMEPNTATNNRPMMSPAPPMLIPNKPKIQPPKNPPTIPMIMSSKSPFPEPEKILLPKNPAMAPINSDNNIPMLKKLNCLTFRMFFLNPIDYCSTKVKKIISFCKFLFGNFLVCILIKKASIL